jgi:hypothetical protein
MSSNQAELFDAPAALPHGLVYLPEFITPAQEADSSSALRRFHFVRQKV